MGYNVYRNRNRLNSETVKETTYTDGTPADNKYLEYQVSAIYSVSGERYSEPVTLTATGIDGVERYNGLKVAIENGDVHVYGLNAGTQVAMYDTNGTLIYKGGARDTGDWRNSGSRHTVRHIHRKGRRLRREVCKDREQAITIISHARHGCLT